LKLFFSFVSKKIENMSKYFLVPERRIIDRKEAGEVLKNGFSRVKTPRNVSAFDKSTILSGLIKDKSKIKAYLADVDRMYIQAAAGKTVTDKPPPVRRIPIRVRPAPKKDNKTDLSEKESFLASKHSDIPAKFKSLAEGQFINVSTGRVNGSKSATIVCGKLSAKPEHDKLLKFWYRNIYGEDFKEQKVTSSEIDKIFKQDIDKSNLFKRRVNLRVAPKSFKKQSTTRIPICHDNTEETVPPMLIRMIEKMPTNINLTGRAKEIEDLLSERNEPTIFQATNRENVKFTLNTDSVHPSAVIRDADKTSFKTRV
jgi:hypothetical protein